MANIVNNPTTDDLEITTAAEGTVQVAETLASSVKEPTSLPVTDNALVRWDSTTGRLVQNSVAILTDAGVLSGLTQISTAAGDLDIITASGGVFKFNDNAIRAGLDAVEFVEMGHGGGNGFINAVGDGGLDFRFEGATLATFTDFGHLHLLTNVDQKHTLKIKTANNLSDTGIAWENSGGTFTHTIFRTDVGSNRADLVFAVGFNADIDLLTNSFKLHGSAANEGRFEVLGELKISSGTPGLNKVLTSDAAGIATWVAPAGGGWSDDGIVVRLTTSTDRVGIGTADPNAPLDVTGVSPGTVGGFASGSLHITSSSASVNANAVITGHNLFGGNKQLWYLGSVSGSNDAIGFINRQNASLSFSTNSVARLTIEAGGEVIINGGVLFLNETTTPTPIANHGALYTKNTNELFFQDGAGTEHLLHGDSFSNLWFHSATVDTVAIATADTFTQIDSFVNIGEEDDMANAVGNVSTDDITIGTNGAGKYKMTFHTSMRSATASSEFIIVVGIVLATPLNISAATNATPIVITNTAHGLLNGDMVTIVGATGNTAANGDWLVSNKTANTFELIDLAGASSVGNGAYDAGSGDVDIKYPGNVVMHREVASTELGAGGANADVQVAAADKVSLYVVNVGATRNLEIAVVTLGIFRLSN